MEHEEWGQRTRNVFLVVAVLEVLGLAFATRPWRRWLYVGSALVGLGGAIALYEAGERGGELVYTYAGGVGIRSGDSTDVARLYLAGLYQQAQLDRRQGKAAEAAGLFAQLARQFPDNLDVQLLAVESLITDGKDGKSALAVLGKLTLPPDDRRLALRRDFLAADAWALANKPDATRAVEHDVIGLPLTGGAAGVRERRILAVHGGRLTVGVGAVLIRIEHLDFVAAHQEDAAVAALLALALGRRGGRPLDVQLAVAEGAGRVDAAAPAHDLHVPVRHLPAGRLRRVSFPTRETLAVEQHNRVGWRRARRRRGHGSHDGRYGPVHRVLGPGAEVLSDGGDRNERKQEQL